MLFSVTLAKATVNSGWTPLHLACYFGHRGVVEELLKVRAVADVPFTLYIMSICAANEMYYMEHICRQVLMQICRITWVTLLYTKQLTLEGR